jgi:hypothetical protein
VLHLIERALALLPPAPHRAALRQAHRLRKLWWRWRKPRIEGVRVLALDAAGGCCWCAIPMAPAAGCPQAAA